MNESNNPTNPTSFFHMSQLRHEIGTIIVGFGKRPLAETEPQVEDILEKYRPEGALDRGESIYLRKTREFSTVGLPYDCGYVHTVEPVGEVARRDLSWTGVLQRRHHRNPRIRKDLLPQLSDEALAACYWRGEESNNPRLEWVAAKGIVIAVDAERSRVRETTTFLDSLS